MDKVEKQVLIADTVKRLTPLGASPLPEQVKVAEGHINLAMTALEDETRRKIEAAKNVSIDGAMSQAQFIRLTAPWKIPELAVYLGITTATLYQYRTAQRYQAVPNKVAAKVIALRKKYNEENGVKADPILDEVLSQMGAK